MSKKKKSRVLEIIKKVAIVLIVLFMVAISVLTVF